MHNIMKVNWSLCWWKVPSKKYTKTKHAAISIDLKSIILAFSYFYFFPLFKESWRAQSNEEDDPPEFTPPPPLPPPRDPQNGKAEPSFFPEEIIRATETYSLG